MKNIKLIIQYDGANYHGWQIQKNKITIQGVIKEKLEMIFQQDIKLIGASRTDAGVHAKFQVANFFAKFERFGIEELQYRLNSVLPLDIRIVDVQEVDKNFNSRKNALKKIYKYYFYNDKIISPFYRNYTWHIQRKIDLSLLEKPTHDLIGYKNFYSFTGQKSDSKTFEREIFFAKWHKNNNIVIFEICANGFLKNMVRKIVGSLIAINEGKEGADFIDLLIKAKDRKKGKYCAPPQGLFLEKIFY